MHRKIKILHIISGLRTGGAEIMLCRTLEQSDPSVFSHRVVSLRGRGALGDRVERSCDLRAMDFKGPRLPLEFGRLVREIRRFEPDIIQTWLCHGTVFGSAAASLAGSAKLVWTIHTGMADASRVKRSIRFLTRGLAAVSGFVPDQIVACSKTAAERHSELGFSTDRMTVIPNGTPVAEFQGAHREGRALRISLGIPPHAPVVGIAGRWTPEKDFPTFFEAARLVQERLPETRFLLCGSDLTFENQAANAFVEQSPLQDRFLLLGLRKDMPAFYSACSLVTLSSRSEAFPLVLGEAMAAGTPCVTTDVGDARDIVGDTGVVVPTRNPPALSQAWTDLLTLDPMVREELGQRAAARIEGEYCLDRCMS
ncbi:MAG: glycosyltransferase, partial [Gemmatimonadetes bacterium]|nr:glycosyltransferase [Gemmatimonadota bacterium]